MSLWLFNNSERLFTEVLISLLAFNRLQLFTGKDTIAFIHGKFYPKKLSKKKLSQKSYPQISHVKNIIQKFYPKCFYPKCM